jgi:hypothetical protein
MDASDLTSGFMTGAIIQFAPGVLKGAMKEYLRQIKFADMVQWVNENRCLWDALPANYQKIFIEYGAKLGKMEWFTVEWTIEAGRKSAPALYSLFIGWPAANDWLGRQIDDIKKNICVGVNNGRV